MRIPLLCIALLALAACQSGPAGDAPIDPEPAAPPVTIDDGLRTEPDAPDTDPADEAAPLTFPHGPYRYVCAEGRAFDAFFPVPDSVRVTFDRGDTVALVGVIAGSGARYSDGTTEAWFRGLDEGFIRENDAMTYADCRRSG